MVDEPNKTSWTVDTLREYLLAIIASNDIKYLERFEASQVAASIAFTAQQTAMLTALTAQKLAVDTALAAADRAVTKAELAADKRFESVNEFRESLADQQRTFMPRTEVELLLTTLAEKSENLKREIEGLRESRSETGGARIIMRDVIAYGIAAAGVIVAIVFSIIK
jgi:SMC interacting uncharacterized protein involved in chromosome segregation